MISNGSIGGGTFADAAIGDGAFSIYAEGDAQANSQAGVQIVVRSVSAGTSLAKAGGLAAANVRRVAGVNVPVRADASGSAVRRSVPTGEAWAGSQAVLTVRRRTVIHGSAPLDAILSIVTAWKSLHPTDAQRRLYILGRRTLFQSGDRRAVRLTESARSIRIPPERDI